MKIKRGCKDTTNDFWYDLSKGGYLKPSKMLANKSDILDVENAIAVLKRFEQACIDQIEDFYQ